MGKDKRKPLVELEKYNGKVKGFWESGQDAAAFYGMSPVLISLCVKGNAKHAKKKHFRYATPEEIELYRNVKQRVEENLPGQQEAPKATEELPNITVEIIPEKVDKPADEDLSPFERLIKKGKEKLI